MSTQDLEQLGQLYVQSTGHGYGLLASREVILTAPGKDTSIAYQAGFKKALELVNEQFKNAEYTIDAKVWLVETIYNLAIGK